MNRVQIGARVAKEYRGGSWAVGTVKPRVIRGKPTEEIRDKRYHGSRIRALSQLTFDASVAGDAGQVDDLALVLMLSGLLFPGEMVKRLRLDRGLTQVDLAKRSMVSERAIRDIETGRTHPRTDTLRAILMEVYWA